jgi:hypothetical protein
LFNIPIKIDNAAKPIINSAKKTPIFQKTGWLIWILAAALIAVSAWLAYLLLTEKTSPLAQFIPNNSTAIIYFKSTEIFDDFKSLKDKNYGWPPFVWATDSVKNLAANNNLAWLNENFKQIFDDQMALALLETNNILPRWLLLTSLKINQSETNAYIEQLEKSLELKYNLISELYRQNKIIRIKHLNQNPNDIYYTNLKNYLLMANDPNLIKKTIDKIME